MLFPQVRFCVGGIPHRVAACSRTSSGDRRCLDCIASESLERVGSAVSCSVLRTGGRLPARRVGRTCWATGGWWVVVLAEGQEEDSTARELSSLGSSSSYAEAGALSRLGWHGLQGSTFVSLSRLLRILPLLPLHFLNLDNISRETHLMTSIYLRVTKNKTILRTPLTSFFSAPISAQNMSSATKTKAPPVIATRTSTCLCKSVQIEVTGEDKNAVLCHCDNCRQASGSAFMYNHRFMKSHITVLKGENLLKVYDDKATKSGATLYRHFCGSCVSSCCFLERLKL